MEKKMNQANWLMYSAKVKAQFAAKGIEIDDDQVKIVAKISMYMKKTFQNPFSSLLVVQVSGDENNLQAPLDVRSIEHGANVFYCCIAAMEMLRRAIASMNNTPRTEEYFHAKGRDMKLIQAFNDLADIVQCEKISDQKGGKSWTK